MPEDFDRKSVAAAEIRPILSLSRSKFGNRKSGQSPMLRSRTAAIVLLASAMLLSERLSATAQYYYYYPNAQPRSAYEEPDWDNGYAPRAPRARPGRSRGAYLEQGPAAEPPSAARPRGKAKITVLPPDADPDYSTPVDHDGEIDLKRTTRRLVADPTAEPAGTLTINTKLRKLFLSLGDGQAVEYRIGVGRSGFTWKGTAMIGRKAFWPGWTPPPEMLERRPDLPEHMDGGPENPLGARALYLFQGNKDTLFRIHGTNEPETIGRAVSSGCIRMLNADVIDLYGRVTKGARVVVL
jgi:lipoprotein-anchoring transpeptidase ErfK/SrfK